MKAEPDFILESGRPGGETIGLYFKGGNIVRSNRKSERVISLRESVKEFRRLGISQMAALGAATPETAGSR